jgi:hypothetical protein
MNNDSLPPFDTTFYHLAYVARWSPTTFLVLKMSNDSLPPKYTTFHHLIYVARWSPTLIYFKKIKKLKKLWGTTLPHRQGGEKLYI